MPRSSKAAVANHASSPPLSSRSSPDGDRPAGPLSVTTDPQQREEVKVNNTNLTDLKNACDDALKRYLSRPELFKQIHLHTDVRLGLGWASVFIAAGTALYGYKVDFETAKPLVWAGVIVYFILTTLQALYIYFIEGDTIFVGKRKTFSKRIITERLTIASRTLPCTTTTQPQYSLSLTYVRSTSGGKSLLARGKLRASKEFNAFFDKTGVMDQDIFEQWVGGVVESAMEGKVE